MKDSAYKNAGVDIEAGENLVERLKPHIKTTKRSGLMGGVGGFGAFFDLNAARNYEEPVLVSSTDGVGTKLKLAFQLGRHETVGVDCVAMCVNDIIVHGAEPLYFLDYFATGKLSLDDAEAVIAGVADGCRQAGCALIGGETAEMPGMYDPGEYDLAGFSVGAIEKSGIIDGSAIQDGDVILGLASSGLHSNGFSLVRKLIDESEGGSYGAPQPFTNGKTLGEYLLTPTRIYARSILKALTVQTSRDNPAIHGMAHITGGGLPGNVPRILPEGLCAEIDLGAWRADPVFHWLRQLGHLSDEDMLQTFNCGIGMIVICPPETAADVEGALSQGENVFRIGEVTRQGKSGDSVRFSNQKELCRI